MPNDFHAIRVPLVKRKKAKGMIVKRNRVGVIARVPRYISNANRIQMGRLQIDFSLDELDNLDDVENPVGEKYYDRREEVQNCCLAREALQAALNHGPWYAVEDTEPDFRSEPPPLFYPKLLKSEDQVKNCHSCNRSKKFFTHVDKMYSKLLCDLGNSDKRSRKTLANFFKGMIQRAECHKQHEIKEFAKFVLELSGNMYKNKDDKVLRAALERWKRLHNYVTFMNSKKAKMEARYASRLGDPRVIYWKSSWKGLNEMIHEGNRVQAHLAKDIEKAVLMRQKNRVKESSKVFSEPLLNTEDFCINRLSNAVVMTYWLKSELANFRTGSDNDSSIFSDPLKESSRLMEAVSYGGESARHVTLCNTKPRRWNKVKPRLPAPLSHLFVFTRDRCFKTIHPSWFRALMSVDKVAHEHAKVLRSNAELERAIQTLEQGIQDIQMRDRMQTHLERELHPISRPDFQTRAAFDRNKTERYKLIPNKISDICD